MITVKKEGGNFELEVQTSPPLLYLDHWAVRELSDNQAAAGQFIDCIKTKGTVLFSWPNVIDISGNTGQSADKIRALLNDIGKQWFPIEFNPFSVIERETSWKDGDNSPCLGEGFLKAYYPHIHGGELSLANIVELTRDQSFRDVALGKISVLADEIRQSLGQARSQRDQPKSGGIRTQDFDRRRPTAFVFPNLIMLLAKETSKFENNDAVDLCHATAAISYGNLICLDSHWADLGKRLRMPSSNLRIFRPGQIAEFLDNFEKW